MQSSKACMKKTKKDVLGKEFETKELLRVFSEDHEVMKRKIFDPRGPYINLWNKCFIVACLVSLFVDPLFFYLASIEKEICMDVNVRLKIVLTVFRSIVDLFYIIQIFLQFRTAFVAPSSRIFGRGELVIDSSTIASMYFRKDFWLDFMAALPLPQVVVWIVIPCLRETNQINTKLILRSTVISQILLRMYLIFPLSCHIIKTAGMVVEAAWVGAAYNLLLYMLASNVVGSCWYLLALERQEQCWKEACDLKSPDCQYWYFTCDRINEPDRLAWFKTSNISALCAPGSEFYQFGIYADVFASGVSNLNFFHKYYYCLWWGLRNLSSIGQNLMTSTYTGEVNFAIIIAILGLVLFALLIGNMQSYLQSTTVRLEEWRIKRTATEEWMHNRHLPHELRNKVREYDLYKWLTTRGVNEEAILKSLPLDIRRSIKRHLCLDLVLRVPLFQNMDEQMLDAVCERLNPVLYTPGTSLVREGDPVHDISFIIRGHLDSYTTDGGRTGFLNVCRIGPGDFSGEELITWALDPRPSVTLLPSSTRTVTAVTEVEAFSLSSEDVKFVAYQFRKLHSKQLRHTFRYHSHQWRTWAACFIQAGWFRYKRRKEVEALKAKEENAVIIGLSPETLTERCKSLPSIASEFASTGRPLAANARKFRRRRNWTEIDIVNLLQKPVELDFSVDDR